MYGSSLSISGIWSRIPGDWFRTGDWGRLVSCTSSAQEASAGAAEPSDCLYRADISMETDNCILRSGTGRGGGCGAAGILPLLGACFLHFFLRTFVGKREMAQQKETGTNKKSKNI